MLKEMTGIKREREIVCNILVKDLKNKKVCARFVHLLTLDQKHQPAASSVESVEMVDDDKNVLKRIVTGDESWCFKYNPETKVRVQLG
jgi:K+ transporter